MIQVDFNEIENEIGTNQRIPDLVSIQYSITELKTNHECDIKTI